MTLSKVMKCERCGMRSMIEPKWNETREQYMKRRMCRSCRTKGQWKVLTQDEVDWD